MSITTVLFDLDGTLLPMDQDVFVNAYFSRLAARLAPMGYEPQAVIHGIWKGTAAMVSNDGSRTNEVAFWDTFSSLLGKDILRKKATFDSFYQTEFQQIQQVCGYHPLAAQTVHRLKNDGKRVVLATNPLFPAIATESRIRWAGLEPTDFEWYTTYENSRHCKPNPHYYRDILEHIQCSPEECLMVGNDVGEDMIAEQLGLSVFLLTDCLINKGNTDISRFPHGGFAELTAYLDDLFR